MYWNIYITFFSDGGGRTGAFCALVTSLERVKQDSSFNLFQTIMLQRIQRPKMVTSLVSPMSHFCCCFRNLVVKRLLLHHGIVFEIPDRRRVFPKYSHNAIVISLLPALRGNLSEKRIFAKRNIPQVHRIPWMFQKYRWGRTVTEV